MAKLTVFNFISINGFYKGINEDISWHRHNPEGAALSEEGLSSGNILIFGRVTYHMMESFWPTPMAAEQLPKVAEGMNAAEKIVFSRTMKSAAWNNTRVLHGDLENVITLMKETSEKDMTILGSGSIVTQCAEHDLIDLYQIMIDPVALSQGTPLFYGISREMDFNLVNTRVFGSGTVLLSYEPFKASRNQDM